MIMQIRSFTELMEFKTFDERFEYLKVSGTVGRKIFGFERYLNQDFYRSKQWRDARRDVIARDEGLDLGIPGYEIYDKIVIHHMNPMTIEDIEYGNPDILNPEYLITTTHNTHMAIHYSDASKLTRLPVERKPGDTKIW